MSINIVPLNCGNCRAPLTVKTRLQPFIKCEHCGTMNAIDWDDNGSASIKMSIVGAVFNQSAQKVLGIVKNELLQNPCPPLDLFSGTKVTDMKRILVPVYWVDDCIGVGYIMYEKAYTVQRIRTTDDGKQEAVDETEWRTENTKVSGTKDFIISANREYNEVIQHLYKNRNLATNYDIQNIDMKQVSEVADNDLVKNNIFSGFIKPEMERYIQEKANDSFSKTGIRNITVNGIDVTKGEIQRLWVEICEVVYNYKGIDYKTYISDNGKDVYHSEIPPIDNDRYQKQENLRKRRSSLGAQALWLMLCMLGVGTLGIFMGGRFILGGGELIIDNIHDIGNWFRGICSIIGGGVALPLAWFGIKKIHSTREDKLYLANDVDIALDNMNKEQEQMDKELRVTSFVKDKISSW